MSQEHWADIPYALAALWLAYQFIYRLWRDDLTNEGMEVLHRKTRKIHVIYGANWVEEEKSYSLTCIDQNGHSGQFWRYEVRPLWPWEWRKSWAND